MLDSGKVRAKEKELRNGYTANTENEEQIGGKVSGRILIVDDEEDITNSIKSGLKHLGLDVDAYNDPIKALAEYEPTKYDIVILDIHMPKLNGFELYRRLKKADGQTIFCFLTAFEILPSEFGKMFPDSDMKTFLKKPISLSELARQLEDILAQRRSVSLEIQKQS